MVLNYSFSTLYHNKNIYKILCEPYEKVLIESSYEEIWFKKIIFKYANLFIEKMNKRKAEYIEFNYTIFDKQWQLFHVPTKGLIRLRFQFLN
jgi:hypothetical protein